MLEKNLKVGKICKKTQGCGRKNGCIGNGCTLGTGVKEENDLGGD